MRGPLRSLSRAAYVAYGSLVSVAVVLSLRLMTAFVRRPSRAVALQRAAARFLLPCLGIRIVASGAGARPEAGARMFVANHSSYLDIPLMLAALDLDFAFVTKSELLDWPVISGLTRAGAHIPVDRERAESRGAVLARIVKTLRAGRSVLIFPEGTFSHDHGLRPFHVGAFKCAVAARVPVIPVALSGVGKVWSQHCRFPRPGTVEICVGDAVEVTHSGSDETAKIEALRAAAVSFIEQHLARA